jgi:acetolactate synthase-1/2/3 large subunit
MSTDVENRTAADAILTRLRDAGVRYLFANAGTDFASIVESMASSNADAMIEPILVPHESVAVAMAHGYTMVTGEPQAVMVHVSVGTANALCALMNASRLEIPMIFMAGRTPITEDRPASEGARTVFVHWAQEMFDQGAMVREFVKWDYELRAPDEVDKVIDRALNMAQSIPKGISYLSLPREVLASKAPPPVKDPPRVTAAAPYPNPDAIAQAAEILLAAENPLIITTDVGRDPAAVGPLGELVERFALPVISTYARYLNLPSNHPMLIDYSVVGHIEDADAVLVLDCDVPWIPAKEGQPRDARVIHMGTDPLYSRYPVRGYRCDVAVTAEPATALPQLSAAMENALAGRENLVAARRDRVAVTREMVRARWRKAEEGMETASPIKPSWLANCVSDIMDDDTILLNEMGVALPHTTLKNPGSYFAASPISGLGWGLGAALGAKMAAPDKLVIAAIGDGSYYFGNPPSAHYCARAYDLPVLYLILDNSAWGAVRRAVRDMYPDGNAVRSNNMPLTSLEPMVAFDKLCEASGGYGERVEDPETLPEALARAVHAVTVEKRQALLHVVMAAP